MTTDLEQTLADARACTLCQSQLPLGPRPVLQASATSRVLIIGQAPGTKVHLSGVPWNDQSGKRLREWLGLVESRFYDARDVAIVPAGLCYPGAKPGGGDNPPMAACAPLWHPRIRPQLSEVRLTLLVGLYAQRLYLPGKNPLTHNVQHQPESAKFVSLPHPSWRVVSWMKANSWFETETLPHLRARIKAALER